MTAEQSRSDPLTAPGGHMPGLDGLRGLLVPVILSYHLGIERFGGFLALEGFFVLSGFLITLLLLDRPPTCRSDVIQWWLRRWRRLLPASTVVAVTTAVVFHSTPGIARDAASMMTWWRNWAMAFGASSYWSTTPSPLKHAWSLSVEEQFYLLFPLLLVGSMAIASRTRRSPASVVTRVCLTLAVVGYGWQAWLATTSGDLNRVYLGTDTRGASILVGCAVGAIAHRSGRRRSHASRWLNLLALLACATLIGLGLSLRIGELRTYQGGLMVAALAWVALTLVASRPGPVATLLSIRPLRWMGVRSYGIYLWSWPIQVLIATRWPTIPTAVMGTVTVVAAFALGDLSLRFVEQPLRGRTGWAAGRGVRRVTWAGGLTTAAFAIFTVSLLAPPTDMVMALSEQSTAKAAMSSVDELVSRSDAVRSQSSADAGKTDEGTTDEGGTAWSHRGADSTTPTSVPPEMAASDAAARPQPTAPPKPLTVLVGGDSQASTIAMGIRRDELPDYIGLVANAGVLGCGVLVRTPGWMVDNPARGGLVDGSYCRGAGSAEDAETIGLSAHPDWLVITSGGYEQAHAYRTPDGRMLPPEHPGIRQAVRAALDVRIRRANAQGTRVALLEFACPGRVRGEPDWDEFTRSTIEWHNTNLREVAAEHPGTITIPPTDKVCMGGDAAGRPTPEKAAAWGTSDRVHVTDEGQGWVWNVQIGPALWAASV